MGFFFFFKAINILNNNRAHKSFAKKICFFIWQVLLYDLHRSKEAKVAPILDIFVKYNT